MTKPVEEMRNTIVRIKNGESSLRVSPVGWSEELTVLGTEFNEMLDRIQAMAEEELQNKMLVERTEFKMFQAQINPHFLYNSLSLINWKALEAGQQDISKITLALSSFYRTSLNRGKNVLTIEKEIENMKSYLEIQLCMHDNDFDVIMDIDEEILQYQTLNLLLQPLVENAIDHGIDLKEDGRGYIKIIGRKDDSNIYLTVEDNGVGIEPGAP